MGYLNSAFELLLSDTENLTISGHKRQLVELAEKDPEFYKFLKEQESDILQFDESDSDVEEGMLVNRMPRILLFYLRNIISRNFKPCILFVVKY